MVDRLMPAILSLQATNRDPITVYINSGGGDVFMAESIIRLLRVSNQDSDPSCRVITVAIDRASSAAADMLSGGDYAIAFPDAMIFYHGVRHSLADPVTVEFGASLTERLKISNDRSAMKLAKDTEWRFMFRFVMMRGQFGAYREKVHKLSMTDLDCFIGLISEHLSEYAGELVSRARERHGRYSSLLEAFHIAFKKKGVDEHKRMAQAEAAVIKKIIDFEVSSHKNDPDWSFRSGGLSRLNDDFFLLNEYIQSSLSEQFVSVCERWGHFALTEEEERELASIADDGARRDARLAKVRPHFEPLFSFLVALCHALQEGERNYLTARDAYWLGLIDEVIGEPLQSPRLLSEFRPEPPPVSPELNANSNP